MLRLPDPTQTTRESSFPIADATGLAIERALLVDDDAVAAGRLAEALRRDPGFALWAVCAAESRGLAPPGDVEPLASWLAANLLELLGPYADASHHLNGQPHRDDLIDWPQVAAHWDAFAQAAQESATFRLRTEAWRTRRDDGLAVRLPPLVAKLRRLQVLARRFNETLEHEKLEAMKSLAYGAGHEINNPLANISARAQTLLKEETDPERRRNLAAINSQVFRAHEMIADLMLFSRPPRLDPRPVDLGSLAAELAEECRPEADHRGAKIVFHAPVEPVVAMVDAVQLKVALRALVINSLEALGAAGTVRINVESTLQTRAAQITVADDGPGVAPENRQRIFDPFFSGREAGRGLGFGLSKCWRIVTDHGGTIRLDDPSPALFHRGAVFVLRFPAGNTIDDHRPLTERR